VQLFPFAILTRKEKLRKMLQSNQSGLAEELIKAHGISEDTLIKLEWEISAKSQEEVVKLLLLVCDYSYIRNEMRAEFTKGDKRITHEVLLLCYTRLQDLTLKQVDKGTCPMESLLPALRRVCKLNLQMRKLRALVAFGMDSSTSLAEWRARSGQDIKASFAKIVQSSSSCLKELARFVEAFRPNLIEDYFRFFQTLRLALGEDLSLHVHKLKIFFPGMNGEALNEEELQVHRLL